MENDSENKPTKLLQNLSTYLVRVQEMGKERVI